MQRRDRQHLNATEHNAAVPSEPAQVLLATARTEPSADVLALLPEDAYETTVVETVQAASEHLSETSVDVVMLDRGLLDAFDDEGLAELLAVADLDAAQMMLLTSAGRFDDAVAAMRIGFRDVIAWPCETEQALHRISRAARAAHDERTRRQRMRRLKSACRKLNKARHEASHQVDVLCRDLVDAYHQMAEQVDEATMAAEFRTLVRMELDVEELLRTALEYMLTRTGPTNAAVFLPNEEGEFGLGAYVNYDCPRQTVSTLLDHLCNAICPQMVDEHETIAFDDAAEFAEWIGINDAGFLADSQVIAFSCRHDDDCLAVVVLFRNQRDPFEEKLAQIIEVLRPIFAAQLAQVVRVHQRGRHEWPEDAHAGDDEIDEDLDFGCNGGMAA